MAIKMTTFQKFEYMVKEKQWNSTTSITAYFTSLDKFEPLLPTAASQQAPRK